MKRILLSLLALGLLSVAGCDVEVEVEGDEPGECSDQADNDQDGAVDCDDDGCAADAACAGDDDDSAGDDDDSAGDDDDSAGDDDDSAGDDDDSADPCSGQTDEGAQRACVDVDPGVRQQVTPYLSGLNANYSHVGTAPWDERINSGIRQVMPGTIRWPGGATSFTMNWRTGKQEPDWALRFETDINCTDHSDCSGSDECVLQPTEAEPDAKQCQTPCTVDSDCAGTDLCLFEQCTNSCAVAPNGDDDDSAGDDDDSAVGSNTVVFHGDDSLCSGSDVCYRLDAARHGCIGKKVSKYLSYNQTLSGKGSHPVGDVVRQAELVGAEVVITVNTRTDSAVSAGELATHLLTAGARVQLWQLDCEPFYMRSSQAPPTFWTDGADYVEDMELYMEALEAAYDTYNQPLPVDEQVPLPLVSISFSDGETSWQRAWDWGKDCMAGAVGTDCGDPPGGADPRPGIGDWFADNGRAFSATDFHWYPGNASTTLPEARDLVAYDLPYELEYKLNNYFLPLTCADQGGLCSDPLDPAVVISEYNIQTTWHSALAAVHAAEFVLRASAQPRVKMMAFHSLLSGCMDQRFEHRQTAKDAATYGRFGVLDSTATNADGSYGVALGEYMSIPCLALQLVNQVVHTSSHTLATSVSGGAVDLVWPDDEAIVIPSGVSPDDGSLPSFVLYAQAYRGAEGLDHLLLTNRSDSEHEVTLNWVGAPTAGTMQSLSAGAYDWSNCGAGSEPIEADTLCVPGGDLTLSAVSSWAGEAIEVPPWGVVQLTVPRAPAALGVPTALTATPGVRSAVVTWGEVAGALSYELRWGVTPGHRTRRQEVTPAECSGGLCEVTLTGLAHLVEHEFTVAASTDEELGPVHAVVTATPLRAELWDGSLGTSTGNATWAANGSGISVTGASGLSIQPLEQWLDTDGDGVTDSQGTPSWQSVSVESQFQMTCTCDGTANTSTGDCGQIGLATRWQDASNHIRAYLYQHNEGCMFLMQRVSSTFGNETLGRSAFIGVPISNPNALPPLNEDGTPQFPEILPVSDGTPHTLRLSAEGELFRLWLDGRLVASGTDESFEAGGAALMVRGQEMTWEGTTVWPGSW